MRGPPGAGRRGGVTGERNTAPDGDGGGQILTVDAGELWLLRFGERLLITRAHADALQAYDEAIAEAGERLPAGRDLLGRAARLLEKQIRTINERTDRAQGAP